MVLFLHNTSQVEDEPYPTLLQDHGFGGFPSLAWMDAEGDVVAEQSDRSVEGFESMLLKVSAYTALKQKADAGDEKAQRMAFISELDFGRTTLEEAKQRFEAIEGFTDAQRAEIAQKMIGLEVNDTIDGMMRRRISQLDAGKKFAELAAKGYDPEGDLVGMFWDTIRTYADSQGDVKLFQKAYDKLFAKYGEEERFEPLFKQLKARLDELKKKDDGGN